MPDLKNEGTLVIIVTGFGKTLRMGLFVKIEFDVCLISSTIELFAKSEADHALCLRSRHTHRKREITI